VTEDRQLACWCGDCGYWRREEKCPECGFTLRVWMSDAEMEQANREAKAINVPRVIKTLEEIQELTGEVRRSLGPTPVENDLEYQKRVQKKIVTGE
jgi:hypothetical protein